MGAHREGGRWWDAMGGGGEGGGGAEEAVCIWSLSFFPPSVLHTVEVEEEITRNVL